MLVKGGPDGRVVQGDYDRVYVLDDTDQYSEQPTNMNIICLHNWGTTKNAISIYVQYWVNIGTGNFWLPGSSKPFLGW